MSAAMLRRMSLVWATVLGVDDVVTFGAGGADATDGTDGTDGADGTDGTDGAVCRPARRTSSARIAPPRPVPVTVARSTPCSSAMRRASGDTRARWEIGGDGAAAESAAAAASFATGVDGATGSFTTGVDGATGSGATGV